MASYISCDLCCCHIPYRVVHWKDGPADLRLPYSIIKNIFAYNHHTNLITTIP